MGQGRAQAKATAAVDIGGGMMITPRFGACIFVCGFSLGMAVAAIAFRISIQAPTAQAPLDQCMNEWSRTIDDLKSTTVSLNKTTASLNECIGMLKARR